MIIIPQNKNNRLPKTGQVTSYATGDDGDIESGLGIPIIRFEEVNINGVDLIKDHHTGLMWPKNLNAFDGGVGAYWGNAVINVNNSILAGFDDWHLANNLELYSIINFGDLSGIYSAFIATSNFTNARWSSNIPSHMTLAAFVINCRITQNAPQGLSPFLYIGCRRF